MGNVLDYMDWRGDLSFTQDSFTDVDNLILSMIAYVGLDGIVPGMLQNSFITLKEASDQFFEIYGTHSEQDEIVQNQNELVMKKAAGTVRFSSIKLSKFKNDINYEEEKQFCAMNMDLPDGTKFIAYRGTDASLVGGKEDFNMSFMTAIPSQIEAAAYLDQTAEGNDKPLRVGGHSKGGNLAVYAAVKCKQEIQKRILTVYNNDGPGFLSEFFQGKDYASMRPKIKKFVPESSVIGMLLEQDGDYVVVKSSATGIMQHDALTWEVMGNHFITLASITPESQKLDETLDAFINGMSKKQREQFVDILFKILETKEMKGIEDATGDVRKGIRLAVETMKELERKTKI